MSTLAMEQPSLAYHGDPTSESTDPFSTSTSSHHRFSHFDEQLFALGPNTSPEQAKRALSAHLAETERRISEAGRLGNSLVQQRKDLAERLKEVEQQQSDGDITPELRQKLVEIEREYNEVGRESARAFLPKSRVSSNELPGSPFSGDGKRSLSPSKFESHGTGSPSKLSVPNRKQRNQPSNRVHDIEFATEISTSLLQQVRNLQTMLNEKEELLKGVTLEKSKLEIEAEGFHQRLRSLDESEHRYKDENWNLETQIHEFLAAAKESADREKRLTQNLNLLQVEKSTAQKELDEIKLSHAKLSDDHAAAIKHHDLELGSVKRNMMTAENERGALQRRIEDLAGQNQELAKAVAHQRGRLEDRDQARGLSDEDFETAPDNVTPEHSPPPSPIKGTPRHSMLESETLKSSLHHAHRMIQNLKGNIHREKTEKLELKRMLQDARDELESRRSELGSANGKKNRKVDSREFKKPFRPTHLGGVRNSRSEVFMDDPNWEEDDGQKSPSRSESTGASGVMAGSALLSAGTDSSDHFDTANETSDAAFETANERSTETEDFQTGVEDMSGSDELTETEGPGFSLRKKPTPLALTQPGNRQSFQSTASTSGDEYSYEEVRTPTVQPQRLRLKVSRGVNRRSRAVSEEPSFQGSPSSFANSSNNGTPQAAGKSLFAELGNLSDEEESVDGTPSRSQLGSSTRPSTAKGSLPFLTSIPLLPKSPMVDSGTMTEVWEPEPATPLTALPFITGGALAGAALTEGAHFFNDKRASNGSDDKVQMFVPDVQPNDEQTSNLLGITESGSSRPISTSTYSDMSSQYDQEFIEEKLANFPSPPTTRLHSPRASLAGLEAVPTPPLTMSTIVSEHVEPRELPEVAPETIPAISLTLSSIVSEQVKPIELPEVAPEPIPAVPLTLSTIVSEHVEPRELPEVASESIPAVPLTLSTIVSEQVEPKELPEIAPEPILAVPLTFSAIVSEQVEPEGQAGIEVEPDLPKELPVTPMQAPVPAPLVFSYIQSVDTEPIAPLSPRDAVVRPSDEQMETAKSERPETPKAGIIGSVFGWNGKKKLPSTPIIAEDDTRQSANNSPLIETPESQRPFRELSSNTNERSPKKTRSEVNDESSQTALTSEQIDNLLRRRGSGAVLTEDDHKLTAFPFPTRNAAAPGVLKSRHSQDSVGSVGRARSKMADPDFAHDTIIIKRPTSAGSARNNSISSIHPPLPTDHKQVIAAAAQRSGSSSGGPGSMGPPLLPASASAQKVNPSFRPRTPSFQGPLSPTLSKSGPTPKPLNSSSGFPEVSSPTGTASRSRKSSVSSFASEIETRFNMRQGVPIPVGLDSGTDPRMINAITQTMIGEYLWKYTRKAGRGAMSENRHRRYFWVHPYTRTLYWSDRDPSSGGRAELKAKSLPIEAVRVVTDDNPMPPGLHRKSLVIMTPGRNVKFTATTGQRHETWFNALSYLLLRTGEATIGDASEITSGALTSEDVAEFNPGFGNNTTRPGRVSLSSYNSRTTRNTSPNGHTSRLSTRQPNGENSTATRPTMGTLSRLSNYMGSFSSRRSRHSVSGPGSFYEASEVHDSAEDLREMIEKQDRESDRLENVRACCDGKHDVGHLHSASFKGRHTSIPPASSSKPVTQTKQSRNSVNRRTD